MKKTIQYQINEFLDDWKTSDQIAFFKEIIPLLYLYNVDDENDWVKELAEDQEDVDNIRLIRSVYLISRICEKFAGKMVYLKSKYPKLWVKMKEYVEDMEKVTVTDVTET